MERLFVIGWGRVGSALGTQAKTAGVKLIGVETRDPGRRRKAQRVLGKANRPLAEADLIALAVPDAAIAQVAAELAPRVRRGQVVFHLNGSIDLAPLAPLAEASALPGSLHPYCSVASAASPLRGCACAIDGGPKARAALRRLALAAGLSPSSASAPARSRPLPPLGRPDRGCRGSLGRGVPARAPVGRPDRSRGPARTGRHPQIGGLQPRKRRSRSRSDRAIRPRRPRPHSLATERAGLRSRRPGPLPRHRPAERAPRPEPSRRKQRAPASRLC